MTKGHIRRWGLDLVLPPDVVPQRLLASVFIKAYESAEIRSLQKLDRRFDAVLDLGASCGILGAMAVRSCGNPKMYIGVEAHPAMVAVARENVRRNSSIELVVEHAAVFYGSGMATMHLQPNIVASHLSHGGVEVPKLTFAQVLKPLKSAENVLLLCDIEGAEWDMIDNDLAQFGRIDSAVIEIHELPGRRVEDFLSIVRSSGLELRCLDGNVVTLVRGQGN